MKTAIYCNPGTSVQMNEDKKLLIKTTINTVAEEEDRVHRKQNVSNAFSCKSSLATTGDAVQRFKLQTLSLFSFSTCPLPFMIHLSFFMLMECGFSVVH